MTKRGRTPRKRLSLNKKLMATALGERANCGCGFLSPPKDPDDHAPTCEYRQAERLRRFRAGEVSTPRE